MTSILKRLKDIILHVKWATPFIQSAVMYILFGILFWSMFINNCVVNKYTMPYKIILKKRGYYSHLHFFDPATHKTYCNRQLKITTYSDDFGTIKNIRRLMSNEIYHDIGCNTRYTWCKECNKLRMNIIHDLIEKHFDSLYFQGPKLDDFLDKVDEHNNFLDDE